MGIRASKRRFFLSLDVTRKCVVEDLDEIQTTGEMKDPPFKNPVLKYYSWPFHFSITFVFSGFRIIDLTGSLYFISDA